MLSAAKMSRGSLLMPALASLWCALNAWTGGCAGPLFHMGSFRLNLKRNDSRHATHSDAAGPR